MPRKPTIFRKVPADQIVLRVPREFRDAIDVRQLKHRCYTVIAFPGGQGPGYSPAMADSRALGRVLPGLDGSEPIVVVASNFTVEALAMIDQKSGHAFRRSHHHWSDASWAHIHDRIGEPLAKAFPSAPPAPPAGR